MLSEPAEELLHNNLPYSIGIELVALLPEFLLLLANIVVLSHLFKVDQPDKVAPGFTIF